MEIWYSGPTDGAVSIDVCVFSVYACRFMFSMLIFYYYFQMLISALMLIQQLKLS